MQHIFIKKRQYVQSCYFDDDRFVQIGHDAYVHAKLSAPSYFVGPTTSQNPIKVEKVGVEEKSKLPCDVDLPLVLP